VRKYTSKAQAVGLRPDGYPNRAMRRQDPHGSFIATQRVVFGIAARLVPGYVWDDAHREPTGRAQAR
jgi:hypothetical protein